MEPNQGGIVQTEAGGWYFFTHHGTGAWEGRCASLLPVTWVDGWPIIGQLGADGIGRMVWSGALPVAGLSVVTPGVGRGPEENRRDGVLRRGRAGRLCDSQL